MHVRGWDSEGATWVATKVTLVDKNDVGISHKRDMYSDSNQFSTPNLADTGLCSPHSI